MAEKPPSPEQIIIEITEQLKPLVVGGENKLGIYKVPTRLKQPDKYAYSPSIVSIGPFHHGLLLFKEQKCLYTLSFLQRTPNAGETLDACVDALWKLEKKARRCYAEHIDYNERKLVEILLLDGCFILELFVRCSDEKFKVSDDPISSNDLMVRAIRRDLVLLENQIPFFILETLLDTVKSRCMARYSLEACFLPAIAMQFFHLTKQPEGGSRHLLDMVHEHYDYISKGEEEEKEEKKGFRFCATKLSDSGIVFEKDGKQGGNLLDILFDPRKGKVKIPPISFDQTIVLRNLLAHEQCSCSTKYHITSYALLLQSLVQSKKDIELLQEKGIIEKGADAAESALAFANSISPGVVYTDFYFTELCADVNKYSRSWWHWHRIKALLLVQWRRYLSELYRDHLSNPWRTASAIAAIVLLVLTLMQTIYTMRS